MKHWRNVVLCSHVLGGAQIFALERMAALDEPVVLRCNLTLRRLIREDERYNAIHVQVIDALDDLASDIRWAHLRQASVELASILRDGGVLLGDLRASAIQLVARNAGRNAIFVHDNSNYLNLKTRWMIALAASRSALAFFACQQATAKLPLRHALKSKLRIEYFAEYRALRATTIPLNATLRIVNVGRIEPNKNQRLAIAISSELARRFRAVELTLLGSVADRAYAKSLFCQTHSPNLRVTTREVRRSQMPALLSAHHIVLHTSLVESLPLVLFEANAAGVPFYALDVGGIAEVLPKTYLIEREAHVAADAIARRLVGSVERSALPQRSTA